MFPLDSVIDSSRSWHRTAWESQTQAQVRRRCNRMRRILRYILLTGGLAGSLSATSVLSCGFNGGALSTSGCYSLPTFSFTESLDWAAAYGSADTVANPNAVYDPITNGPWNATTG